MLLPRALLAAALGFGLPAAAALAQKPPPLDDGLGNAALAKPPPLGEPVPAPPPREAFRQAPARGEVRAVASGSGFMVAEGRAVTNDHVAGECLRATARNTDGRIVSARVMATDRSRDLALLALPSEFAPALIFRDTPPVERGDDVVTYGFPLVGLLSSGPTLTTGIVSALTGLRDTPLHYTITAPVQPGNSGGPALDGRGHVIGIVVAKLNAARVARITGGDIPQNVNFAIKGQVALDWLRAEGIDPAASASEGPDLGAAEIGRIADRSTLFLQCYR